MSFNDIDDTLVAYFKQMLEEESEQQSPESESLEEQNAVAQTEVSAQNENDQVIGSGNEVSDSQPEELPQENEIENPQEDMTLSASDGESSEVCVADETSVEESSDEKDIAAAEVESEICEDNSDPAPDAIAEAEAATETEETEDMPLDTEESPEEVACESEEISETLVENEESSLQNTAVETDNSADDIDYAADDYVPEDNSSSEAPVLQPQLQSVEEKSEPLPFAEHKSLESLLESVPKTQLETEVADETATETAVETQTVEETQIVTETAVEEQIQVEQVTASESVVADESAVKVEQESDNEEAPYNWTNIEMPDEFQVLFFLVKGIRFAVPLVNLGGIFQCDKVTPLFGKPDWFQGIADIRGRKMNVVDTLKWVKSDAPQSEKYEYMISLDKTLWSIGCDVLEGNRILKKENITWRQTAGNRPWLAGIVKKEMCALLHVKALIKMFENGVNLKDLDVQMSA
ncbi:MAG: chemotaxis protein CheW [Succinivibrio dextrinosolvens]|nr:chemotaxis protein CheW [Succinivibrio dextrinosolvens]